MQVSTFDSVARQIALESIEAYQTYISPRKGFSCAHRMLHQGESCSDYVKRLFATQNLMSAVLSSRQRFRDCAAASQTLRATKSSFRCIVIPCCLPI
ncbi:membrane protein insertion efficiency factor YidD [Kamptonema formosum]|uniref:membrane protein insertion efficiency factor YidD n=1 Tax=Kamptonema formosum TaxID=331992 RepID=UPI0008FBE80B|nr:membrane protein insertion efficiency factor YidD [Oscillatoria sp. PCC 10802]